jgi:hypothetical protein
MKHFIAALCAALLLAAPLLAATASGVPQSPKNMSQRTLNINAWTIACTNYGPFVTSGSWGGPGYGYIYGAGLWVGGAVGSDTAVAVGYNPNSGQSEMSPANPYTWDWTNWLTDPVIRLYLSTDSADLANWPLRDGANDPIVLSAQDGYATVCDDNPQYTFTGEQPLHIRYRQQSYAWNFGTANDVVYFRFTVFNPTADTLRQMYVGPGFDADIGVESAPNANDRTSFDYTRNLAIQFQTTPEPGWPVTGVFGCRYFQSPVNSYLDTVWVVDNQFTHGIAPGEPLGLTAFKIFTIAKDPSAEMDFYHMMQGYTIQSMVMDAYDEWGAETPGDKRFIMASGPFDLAPGDSAIICIGVMVALDTNAVKALSDSAQAFYEAHLGVASAPSAIPMTGDFTTRNLPNPFRQSTIINYQLSKPGLVSLNIYNVSGQLVKTIIKAQQPAGSHSVRWDGRDDNGRAVAAGVYLYQLRAGDKALTRKMVLVR